MTREQMLHVIHANADSLDIDENQYHQSILMLGLLIVQNLEEMNNTLEKAYKHGWTRDSSN